MKYFRLHIDMENTKETYNEITNLLGLKPTIILLQQKQ